MSKWTNTKVAKALMELEVGAQDEGDIDDSMAYDIADGFLASSPGLLEFIRDEMKIRDVLGYVANRVM